MKKLFSIFATLSVAMFLSSCFGDGKSTYTAKDSEAEAEVSEEVNAEAEEAVKAYEDWFAKYDELTARSAKGEDVYNEIMALQENVFGITEKLLKTERKRNADQKARVKDIEEKVEQIKKERVFKL